MLVKGANYSIEGVVGRELAEGWGAQVKTLSLTPNRSTTGLMEKVIAMRRAQQGSV